jgi:hypothetical protein
MWVSCRNLEEELPGKQPKHSSPGLHRLRRMKYRVKIRDKQQINVNKEFN